MPLDNYIPTAGQSLIDIAIQKYGCFEGVFLLSPINKLPLLSLPQHLIIDNEIPILTKSNRLIATYFNTRNINVNAGHNTIAFVDEDYAEEDYTGDNEPYQDYVADNYFDNYYSF